MREKVKEIMGVLQGQGGSGGGCFMILLLAFWRDIYVASLKLMLVLCMIFRVCNLIPDVMLSGTPMRCPTLCGYALYVYSST